jgi:TPR repeat protein
MMFPARILVIVTAVAAFGAAASADGLRDGTMAFSDNAYSVALPLLQPLSDEGNPIAGCMVKMMLDRSQGRVAYDADAMASTCLAAASGQRAAQLDLAGNYRTGLILAKDEAKAFMLYQLAADQGSPVAQKVLGDFYAEGIGVTRDLIIACQWWGRAARQGGSEQAERNFGTCYLTGTGVPRSEVQALAWWLIAKSDEKADKDGLPGWVFQSEGDADRLSNSLMQRLPADQVAEAQALARAWQPKAE